MIVLDLLKIEKPLDYDDFVTLLSLRTLAKCLLDAGNMPNVVVEEFYP